MLVKLLGRQQAASAILLQNWLQTKEISVKQIYLERLCDDVLFVFVDQASADSFARLARHLPVFGTSIFYQACDLQRLFEAHRVIIAGAGNQQYDLMEALRQDAEQIFGQIQERSQARNQLWASSVAQQQRWVESSYNCDPGATAAEAAAAEEQEWLRSSYNCDPAEGATAQQQSHNQSVGAGTDERNQPRPNNRKAFCCSMQ